MLLDPYSIGSMVLWFQDSVGFFENHRWVKFCKSTGFYQIRQTCGQINRKSGGKTRIHGGALRRFLEPGLGTDNTRSLTKVLIASKRPKPKHTAAAAPILVVPIKSIHLVPYLVHIQLNNKRRKKNLLMHHKHRQQRGTQHASLHLGQAQEHLGHEQVHSHEQRG
jgi:hypothetical protein